MNVLLSINYGTSSLFLPLKIVFVPILFYNECIRWFSKQRTRKKAFIYFRKPYNIGQKNDKKHEHFLFALDEQENVFPLSRQYEITTF